MSLNPINENAFRTLVGEQDDPDLRKSLDRLLRAVTNDPRKSTTVQLKKLPITFIDLSQPPEKDDQP